MLDNQVPPFNRNHDPIVRPPDPTTARPIKSLVSVCQLDHFEAANQGPNLVGVLAPDTRCQQALEILFRALQSAAEHGRPTWDFAIEISEMTDVGIGKHVLRDMVCQGLIEHRRETTKQGQDQRSFIPETDVVLSPRSCFVLNDLGRCQLETIVSRKEQSVAKRRKRIRIDSAVKGGAGLIPIWDAHRRELRLGDIVVKRFKWPASNQEQILRAFQEEGWPTKIDDPLPPNPRICPKRRLHDTIKCLNRRQVNSAIKFHGDGTGQGVLLEILTDSR